MTTYTLPPELGGAEVQDVTDTVGGLSVGIQTLMGNVLVVVPGVGLVSVPRNKLTEVVPALPEEPPNGAVISNGADAFMRCDDEADTGESRWYVTGEKQAWMWKEAQREMAHGGPWLRMVPDPAATAELPFALGSCERSAMVNTLDGGRVALAIENEWYTPEEARRIAAAILRAAAEAERGAS